MTRALAIIDGEHYLSTVKDALEELPYEFVAAHLVGGTEKLRGGEDYGVPLVDSLTAALEHDPEVVVDLSDEPVLGPPDRLRLASRALALGLPYVGADFRFDPPALEPFDLPSIGIVGTGKRVGKTAVGAHAARVLSERYDVVVVAMGRGGPAEPEVAETAPTIDDLLALSRSGRHAASDYLEDAALAGVVTIGCRRAGGGLAGAPFVSNVHEGAALAAERAPDLVIFEGSGAAFPPIDTSKRVLVVGGGQSPEVAAGYLNAYRILVSDLVLVIGDGASLEAIRALTDVPVLEARLRPRPAESVEGPVAVFTTAPADAREAIRSELMEQGFDVRHVSSSLADRDALRTELESVDAETILVELKAAAIDVVAEAAAERGARLVLLGSDVVAEGLDERLLALADDAVREQVRA
ncbi:MAG: cyclic 2,3-diphosphoglycerate synthase [Gaiellaceae bacterium]|nr:cyclic 2,3-diphosphoglycerate synthase [Gaiellaceae bacterium]